MALKYVLRECRIHILMSVLCLIQAVILFAVVTGMVSIFMARFSGYRPVRRLVEQNGYLCNVYKSVHLEEGLEHKPVQNAEAYEKMLKGASVCGQYRVDAFIGEDQEVEEARKEGSYISNLRAYDDGWIRGYQPKMQSGNWLKPENTKGEQLEAVVLQTEHQYHVGDTVELDNNCTTKLQTKIPVKIVGVLDSSSDFIFHSNENGFVDYKMLFSNMEKEVEDSRELTYLDGHNGFLPVTFFVSKKNLDSVQEHYADLEAKESLSENDENVPAGKQVIFYTELDGLLLITLDKDASDELFRYDKNRIAQISQFHFLHDLSYIKKNTWQNIMADISDYIPAGIGMVLFTMISFITLSTLMYQKNMRKYSIYYTLGLTWRNIFQIHILYIALIISAALILGTALINIAGCCGIGLDFAARLGVEQALSCLAVLVVLIAVSALMCLSLLKGKSAKEIIQEAE